jgi:hypothetical protein
MTSHRARKGSSSRHRDSDPFKRTPEPMTSCARHEKGRLRIAYVTSEMPPRIGGVHRYASAVIAALRET